MKDKAKEILDNHLQEGIVCHSRTDCYIDGCFNDGKNKEGIFSIIESAMIEFAKQMCEEQKRLCAKEARIKYDCFDSTDHYIDESSILNCKNVCE